jgi:hypothetical protein
MFQAVNSREPSGISSVVTPRATTAIHPDTILAAFDKVLASDSTLTPALIHPLELTLGNRDSARFGRYLRLFGRTAPLRRVAAHRAASGLAWGRPPSDSELRAALAIVPQVGYPAVGAGYREEAATSDTVLTRLARLEDATPKDSPARGFSRIVRGFVLTGLGRLREARALADTVAAISPGAAAGMLGWPVALGIAPPAYGARERDSLVALDLAGMDSPRTTAYVEAVEAMVQGRTDEAIRKVSRGMVLPDQTSDSIRTLGLLEATGGWARLVRGDTARGIEQLRSGLAKTGGPHSAERTAFLRFQLALALAADTDTRDDGINRLRYGFDNASFYLAPLAALALGRTYEAAGKTDSAAAAYGRFIRLWDKADPELQGRVVEAREALQRLTAEPR